MSQSAITKPLRVGCVIWAAVVFGSSPVYAQDLAGVGESMEYLGPQNLPGHDKRTEDRANEPVEGAEPADEEGAGPWWQWERATGDWGGTRTKLESGGLSFEGAFIGEWSSVWDGGVKREASVRSLVDINVTLDFERAFDWKGGQAFADFYWIDGNSLSGDAGDFQGLSNIEAPNRLQVAELWIEQVFFDGSLRVKFGKIEGNSEFAFVDSAGEFTNSSAGFSPTVMALPTYPDPSTGLIVSWMPADWVSLTGGFMDGAAAVDGVTTGDLGPASFFNDNRSDDYFWVGEANFFWEGGRAGIGVWHHTGNFALFSGGMESGTTGYYALVEHRVWSPDESGRGVDAFAQLGWADEDVSDAHWHFGAGVVWTGPFESRPDDMTGVYVTFVDLSDLAGYTEDETIVEVFYRVQVTPAVAIKPDLQVVSNPSGSSVVDDAVVGGVRVEVTF